MTQFLDMLGSALKGGQLDQLAQQIGATPQQTEQALQAALPALLGGLSRNVAQPQGAQALAGALERDHDGSLLDGLGGLLQGAGPQTGLGGILEMAGSMLGAAPGPGSARTTNAGGILGHILGPKRGAVEQGMAKASGLDMKKTGMLLAILAPLVMGALGKAKRGGGLDSGGIGDMIRRESGKFGGGTPQAQTQTKAQTKAGGGFLGGLLDKDDDGSIADDLAKMAGRNILGGLFR